MDSQSFAFTSSLWSVKKIRRALEMQKMSFSINVFLPDAVLKHRVVPSITLQICGMRSVVAPHLVSEHRELYEQQRQSEKRRYLNAMKRDVGFLRKSEICM